MSKSSATRPVSAIEVHTQLREDIDKLKTLEDCKNFYEGNTEFRRCIDELRNFRDNFSGSPDVPEALVPAWVEAWAKALASNEEDAWTVNHCRKTILKWLYQVCNVAPPSNDPEEEARQIQSIIDKVGVEPLEEVAMLGLPMDKGNCLLNMVVTETGERGLGWYSKSEETAYKNLKTPQLPLNASGGTINKRFKRLQNTVFKNNSQIQKWLQVAAPERVAK